MNGLSLSLGLSQPTAGSGEVAAPDKLVVPATSAYFQDPLNIPANTSRITMRGTFSLPILSGTAPGTAIFNGISNPIRVTVQSDGAIKARVETQTGSASIDAEVAPAGTFSIDTEHVIVFDADHATQLVTITVDGTDYTAALSGAATDTFQTSRKVQFLSGGANPLVPAGSIVFNMSVDYNGTLRKTIPNDAALANADGWHVGANFTQAV